MRGFGSGGSERWRKSSVGKVRCFFFAHNLPTMRVIFGRFSVLSNVIVCEVKNAEIP